MTQKELSQLYYLRREVEMDTRRLRELECGVSPASEGERAALRRILRAKRRRCARERRRLEAWIAAVEDSRLRQILTCRFVDGLSWRQTALRTGGGNTADGVRMAVKRFLREK